MQAYTWIKNPSFSTFKKGRGDLPSPIKLPTCGCDCNWTRTHNHLVHKWTLNHLAKLAVLCLWTKWLWVPVQLQSLKVQISCLLWARSSLTFRRLYSVDSLWNAYVTWQGHAVTCECGWICINIHEYLWISSRMLEQALLSMPGLWICMIILHVRQTVHVSCTCKAQLYMDGLHKVLYMCQYGSIHLNNARICLNMP